MSIHEAHTPAENLYFLTRDRGSVVQEARTRNAPKAAQVVAQNHAAGLYNMITAIKPPKFLGEMKAPWQK